MKTAIVYASVHHNNTKKLLDAIASNCGAELLDAVRIKSADLTAYDAIGFASGIYYSKFHASVLEFAAKNLPDEKDIFLIYTYGAKRDYAKNFMNAVAAKKPRLLGTYGCRGFDTFGPFKFIGGVAKGHPNGSDIAGAVEFYKGLEKAGGKT